jgi:hypothetical protein
MKKININPPKENKEKVIAKIFWVKQIFVVVATNKEKKNNLKGLINFYLVLIVLSSYVC